MGQRNIAMNIYTFYFLCYTRLLLNDAIFTVRLTNITAILCHLLVFVWLLIAISTQHIELIKLRFQLVYSFLLWSCLVLNHRRVTIHLNVFFLCQILTQLFSVVRFITRQLQTLGKEWWVCFKCSSICLFWTLSVVIFFE